MTTKQNHLHPLLPFTIITTANDADTPKPPEKKLYWNQKRSKKSLQTTTTESEQKPVIKVKTKVNTMPVQQNRKKS